MRILAPIALALALTLLLTGCGMMQSYNQYLDNRQRTFERNQSILDAQRDLQVAQIQVQVAKQEALVNIATAEGKAKAQEIQTRTLTPIFVQQELVTAIDDGKVNTIVLPGNSVLPLNLFNPLQGAK